MRWRAIHRLSVWIFICLSFHVELSSINDFFYHRTARRWLRLEVGGVVLFVFWRRLLRRDLVMHRLIDWTFLLHRFYAELSSINISVVWQRWRPARWWRPARQWRWLNVHQVVLFVVWRRIAWRWWRLFCDGLRSTVAERNNEGRADSVVLV
jgi:hypothetical protein